MKVREYFNQNIAPLLKKRLVIPLIYFFIGLAYTRDLTNCLSRVILVNSILLSVLLVRPKTLLSFDAVLTILFLLWVAKVDNTNSKAFQRKWPHTLQNPFFQMSVWSFEQFIDIFTFYMVLFGMAVFFQASKELFLNTDSLEDEDVDPTRSHLGLMEKELDNLEVEAYMDTQHRFDTTTSNHLLCSICLVEFQIEERVVSISGCKHTFHESCIKKWLKTLAVCPYCRRNVRQPEALSNLVKPGIDPIVQNANHSSTSSRQFRYEFCQLPNLRAYL